MTASGRRGQVAASGRKCPLLASGREWPQVAAFGKWPRVAASGRLFQFQIPHLVQPLWNIHEFLLSSALIELVKVKCKTCSEFGEELQHLKRLLECSMVLNLAAWMIPSNGISFEEARI